MARKKKSEEQLIKEVSKLIAEETLQDTDPVVVSEVKGSHLTVTTYSNGSTKLTWDDEALMRDVQNAIASLENLVTITEEKVKKTRKKKVAS